MGNNNSTNNKNTNHKQNAVVQNKNRMCAKNVEDVVQKSSTQVVDNYSKPYIDVFVDPKKGISMPYENNIFVSDKNDDVREPIITSDYPKYIEIVMCDSDNSTIENTKYAVHTKKPTHNCVGNCNCISELWKIKKVGKRVLPYSDTSVNNPTTSDSPNIEYCNMRGGANNDDEDLEVEEEFTDDELTNDLQNNDNDDNDKDDTESLDADAEVETFDDKEDDSATNSTSSSTVDNRYPVSKSKSNASKVNAAKPDTINQYKKAKKNGDSNKTSTKSSGRNTRKNDSKKSSDNNSDNNIDVEMLDNIDNDLSDGGLYINTDVDSNDLYNMQRVIFVSSDSNASNMSTENLSDTDNTERVNRTIAQLEARKKLQNRIKSVYDSEDKQIMDMNSSTEKITNKHLKKNSKYH